MFPLCLTPIVRFPVLILQDISALVRSIRNLYYVEMGRVRFDCGAFPVEDLRGERLVHRHVRAGNFSA